MTAKALIVVFIETFIVRYCFKYSCLQILVVKKVDKKNGEDKWYCFAFWADSEAPSNVKKM